MTFEKWMILFFIIILSLTLYIHIIAFFIYYRKNFRFPEFKKLEKPKKEKKAKIDFDYNEFENFLEIDNFPEFGPLDE
jgi:hypothetical protein